MSLSAEYGLHKSSKILCCTPAATWEYLHIYNIRKFEEAFSATLW